MIFFVSSNDVTSCPDLTNQRVGGLGFFLNSLMNNDGFTTQIFLEPTRNLRDPTGLKKCKAKIRAFAKRTTVTGNRKGLKMSCLEIHQLWRVHGRSLFFFYQVFSDQRLGALICDLFFNILYQGCLMFMISYFDLKNYDVLMFQHH